MPRDTEFTDLTTNLERTAAYRICVLGMTSIGLGVGSFVPGLGTLAGGVVGVTAGLVMCPKVAPALRHKLFKTQARFNPDEFRNLVRQTKAAYPRLNTKQALELIADARMSSLKARQTKMS